MVDVAGICPGSSDGAAVMWPWIVWSLVIAFAVALGRTTEEAVMYVGWASVRVCESFWTWLYFSWDVRAGWDGPYRMRRVGGLRVMGFEWEREYIKTSD